MPMPVRVFLVFGAFFALTSIHSTGDTKYTSLVARELALSGSLELDRYAPPPYGPPDAVPSIDDLGYQLIVHDGHVYHRFPVGTPALMAPLVGVLECVGLSVLDERGVYVYEREYVLLHLIAALCAAALVAVFYLQARLRLDERTSLWLAGMAGLSVPVWTIAAGTLWSHTLCVLLLGWALLLVLRGEQRGEPPAGWLVGTLLSWTYFVRPAAAVSIAVLTLWLLVRWRTRMFATVATGAAWLIAFVAHSYAVYSVWLPQYYAPGKVSPWPLPEALLGNLVSPGRGLLVYVPALIWLGALLFHVRRRIEPRGLALAALAACALHWWIASSYLHWWAGWSWGPRVMTDLVPWLVMLAILGLAALPGEGEGAAEAEGEGAAGARPPAYRPRLLATLLVLGTALAAIGNWSPRARSWNHDVVIDQNPHRVWDWLDPPFRPL